MPFEIIIPVALVFFIIGVISGSKAKMKDSDHEFLDAAMTNQNNKR